MVGSLNLHGYVDLQLWVWRKQEKALDDLQPLRVPSISKLHVILGRFVACDVEYSLELRLAR
jgi:hypothetical protein